MNSNTGTAQTYEAHEQRPPKQKNPDRFQTERFETEPSNAHNLNDGKDSRTLRNREELEIKERRKEESNEESSAISDPTAPARSHGNKPSRGAEIDAELQRDDELRLQEKGIKQ